MIAVVIWIGAFLVSAALRDPVGNYLAQYASFSPDYTRMIVFLFLFVVIVVAANLLVQANYKRVPLVARLEVVDELLGGLLAAGVGVLVLAVLILILDSYFLPRAGGTGEGIGFLSSLNGAFNASTIATMLRESLIPGLTAALAPLLPADLQRTLP